jgi:hypothetical protein
MIEHLKDSHLFFNNSKISQGGDGSSSKKTLCQSCIVVGCWLVVTGCWMEEDKHWMSDLSSRTITPEKEKEGAKH